jgi:predicted phosphate transport protein (TIGR00153 family)
VFAARLSHTIVPGHTPLDRRITVGFRLTPQENGFYELFAKSASYLVEGARELTTVLGIDPEERVDVAKRMREIEHLADEATHDIIRKVNTSFITPFDREDIHGLAVALDDCMDHMDACVDLIVLYRLGALPASVSEQVQVLSRMSELTAEAMPRLRSMKDLSEYWIEINRLENQADQLYRRLLADLFNGDFGSDPITVMKLKEVVEELEAAADAFEGVAHKVEGIAVKES